MYHQEPHSKSTFTPHQHPINLPKEFRRSQKPMNYQYLPHINIQPTNYQLPIMGLSSIKGQLIVNGLKVDVEKILIIHGLLIYLREVEFS